MSKDSIVTINGQQYDSLTGLPIAGVPTDTHSKKPTPAGSIHNSLQRSKTLIRRVTKKPSPISNHRPKHAGQTMDIARSSKVARFAPHPVVTAPAAVTSRDLPVVASHPLLSKTNKLQAKRSAVVAPAPSKSSQDIKNDAITAALAKPPVKIARKHFFNRHPRAITIIVVCIVVALVGGYLTYVNMPGLSVRVAAAQAGINATYPQYQPDGYSLNGPVTFSNGQVTINFVANTGTSKFSIKQAKSTWDSTAVLNDIVLPKAGEQYITNQEQGLTIYTYSGDAAWVNGGILYTIDGDAPLSGDQIRQIATSM
ncbi:MAG: hypothetical protein JWN26_674 [Candidatus Saccharibacteria bacterium]|nr:hypothetical protein [Candidatus Saccharibacteria bacterium]